MKMQFNPITGAHEMTHSTTTDHRFDVKPELAAGYLPHLLRYDIVDYENKRAAFSQKAFAQKLTYKQAADAWDAQCRQDIKTRDAEIERKALSEYIEYGYDIQMTAIAAEEMINDIMMEKNHPYHDPKHPNHERQVLVMQRLHEIKAGQKTDFGGCLLELGKEKLERDRINAPRSSSNGIPADRSLGQPDTQEDSIGYGEQPRKSGHGQRIEDAK